MAANSPHAKPGTGGAVLVDETSAEAMFPSERTCPMCRRESVVIWHGILEGNPNHPHINLGIGSVVPANTILMRGYCVASDCKNYSLHLPTGEMIWPKDVSGMPEPQPSMPVEHQELYNAARLALRVSQFRAPTMLMRGWMDGVLVSLGYNQETLEEKIIAFSRQASKELVAMLRALQWLGNDATHSHENDRLIDFEDVTDPSLLFHVANRIADEIWGTEDLIRAINKSNTEIRNTRKTGIEDSSTA